MAVLISTLYISQSVPVSFIKTGFQVFLNEQNIESDSISRLMGLLLMPWALKLLWAPIVDRIGYGKPNHRKKWIIPLQIIGALLLAGAAFLDLKSQLIQIYTLFFIYSFICATQDIAVDGLAVLSLSRKQHGIGNTIQMGGYYLGELLGGASILILFNYFGWTVSILFLALFFLLPLPFLIPFKEEEKVADPEKNRPSFKTISHFVWNNKFWLFVAFLYMGNQVLARTMLPKMLADRNFNMAEIGFITGVLGNAASIVGAIVGGVFIEKIGRKRSLLIYGSLKVPAFFCLLLIPMTEISKFWVLSGILLNDFLAGLSVVALFTVMMDKSRKESPGTDFTIQQSFNAIGILFFVILSGILLKNQGLSGLISTSTVIGVVAVVLAAFLKLPEEKKA